ncbi:MFS transporter [Gordonia amarae]|uniref:MFS transporter n=2 Tax=Gordonia amarae TaxID=36821 RepID=A0A857KIA3_9ACTN|nr:MFS transporter [Gordonia amarae]MCS3877044.1 MFS family permease [Gordonia amarae]QHN15857.1 MFS transporter [Gordonia amarae]QHN20425.1 MFS transporter [Gordonia amarae]QHN29277.1 MFS transporter [Gordonia amarae]QHN38055.1 MFS transporter [Gordonia amarae]
MTSQADLPKVLRPFGTRQYRWLAAGLALALFGDGIWLIAVVWQVIDLGGGPAQVSLVSATTAVGMLVSSLAGGVLADRVSQRLITIGLEATKLVAFASVGVAAMAGVLTFGHLLFAALLSGITTGMYYPAYSALLPNVVEAAHLQAANGVEGFMRPVFNQAAGPMIAGVVIGMAAPGQAVVLAGIASALSGWCYVAMGPVTHRREPVGSADSFGARAAVSDIAEGVRYMLRTPWLWATLFFATVLVLATMGPIEVLVPFALRDRAGGDAGDHSLVLMAFGAGAAIASLTFASIPMPRRYLTLMLGVWGVSSVPLVIMAFADRTWMFVAAAFVLGVLFDGPMVIWGTLLQRRVPPHLLGRVASLDFFVSVALLPVSMAIVAPVSHAIGYPATFILAGLLPVPCALVFYLAARLWRDEIEHPLRDEPGIEVSVAARGDHEVCQ